jgi:small conductance mechanosensitive channel
MMIAWLTQHLRHRGMRYLCLGLLSLGMILWATPTLAQLPTLFSSPAARPVNSSNLPSGVQRFGDLEVAMVVSPYTGQDLFLVASSTILDRDTPPEGVLPVEARATDIEGRLRLVYRRIAREAMTDAPEVVATTLNQTPILVISDGGTRNLTVVTVTEQDSAFHAKTREQLAKTWQEILQEDVATVYELTRPQEQRRRWGYAAAIIGGLIAFSLLGWLLRRLFSHRQNFLTRQKQEEDQKRSNLIADTAANQEKQSVSKVSVDPDAAMTISQDATSSAPPAEPNNSEELAALLNYHRALLASLRQKFGLKRRIRFYTLLKWLLFWATILAWYGGIYAIASIVPSLMRWRYWILATPLKILLIWFAVGLAIRISHALIDARTIKQFSTAIPSEMTANPAEEQRRELQASTITGALEGLATVSFIALGMLSTLNSLNVSTGSLLAGGAILGFAISFGSQSLVKDLVNGVLILFEDQFAIGDVVAIDQDAGVVENVNLRITQVRNTQGELITIPNSSINRVKNMTRLWSRVDFVVEVAYENDIDAVIQVLNQTAQDMYHEEAWHDLILEPPEMLGVDQLSHTGMLIRIWLKTAPMQQWAVGREYRRRVRRAFAQHNIQIGRPEWISYNTGWHSPNGSTHEESPDAVQQPS